MYLVGAAHPHKIDARHLLESAIVAGERLVTNAEVPQEILHRFFAIRRREAIQPAFEALLGAVDEVFPVELRDVQRGRDLLLGIRGVSARDALHAATMERYGVQQILSFDTGFDRFPGVRRISRGLKP